MKLASSVLRGGEILPEKRVVDMTFTNKQRELVSIAGGQSVEFQSTRSIFRERDLRKDSSPSSYRTRYDTSHYHHKWYAFRVQFDRISGVVDPIAYTDRDK